MRTVASPLAREIRLKLEQLRDSRIDAPPPPMYSDERIDEILAECDRLIASVAGSELQWTSETREAFVDFLQRLPGGAYPTPEQAYAQGKPRQYREHVEKAATWIEEEAPVILDVAGCTGWASTVFAHLGYPRAVTIELNPINIIGGRYVWGHRSIIQGDAHRLRECQHPEVDFRQGGAVDLIFCRYALEHFQHLEQVFAEFHHALRPGGRVFAVVGRGAGRPKEDFGDVRSFPDAASVYCHAPAFCMIHYELIRNVETGFYEHFAVLQRPDDPALLSHAAMMKVLTANTMVGRIGRRFRRLGRSSRRG